MLVPAEPGTSPTSGGPPGPPLLPRVARLFAGLLILLACAFVVLPALRQLSAVGPTIDLLERADIEAGAFWYAHVEKVGVAERHIASLDLIHESPGRAAPATAAFPALTR